MTSEQIVARARWAELWEIVQGCALRKPAAFDRARRIVAEIAMTAADMANDTPENLEAAASNPGIVHYIHHARYPDGYPIGAVVFAKDGKYQPVYGGQRLALLRRFYRREDMLGFAPSTLNPLQPVAWEQVRWDTAWKEITEPREETTC